MLIECVPFFEKNGWEDFEVFCTLCHRTVGVMTGTEIGELCKVLKKGVLCFECDNVGADKVHPSLDDKLHSVQFAADNWAIEFDWTRRACATLFVPSGQNDERGNRLFIPASVE